MIRPKSRSILGGDTYGDYKQCLNCGMLEDISKPDSQEAVQFVALNDMCLVPSERAEQAVQNVHAIS